MPERNGPVTAEQVVAAVEEAERVKVEEARRAVKELILQHGGQITLKDALAALCPEPPFTKAHLQTALWDEQGEQEIEFGGSPITLRLKP